MRCRNRRARRTHYLGLAVALPQGNPLVFIPVEYTPDVNDLADLLAAAMRRPMTADAHRPRRIAFRGNPRWAEMFPHLNQLGIEVSVQNQLPAVDEAFVDFLRQMRRAKSNPLILYTPSPTDIEKAFTRRRQMGQRLRPYRDRRPGRVRVHRPGY